MQELQKILRERAFKAVAYFESQLQKNGSYGPDATDLSCYFKSPMMFIQANKNDLANLVLDYLKATFMTKDGDFTTTPSLKSAEPEFCDYWSYMTAWITRAAQFLQRNDIAEPAYKFLSKFNVGHEGGVLTHALEKNDGRTDILSTALHGFVNLERGNISISLSIGNYLCEALNKQPDINHVFYARFNKDGSPITTFANDQSASYCIMKSKPDQFYYLIGLPCAYLALLYKKTTNQKYLNSAKAYFDFAASSYEDVFSSNFSHKLAWAASILYSITREAQYFTALEKITNYFMKNQSERGLWYEDADINTRYDQSVEIACWFLAISDNL